MNLKERQGMGLTFGKSSTTPSIYLRGTESFVNSLMRVQNGVDKSHLESNPIGSILIGKNLQDPTSNITLTLEDKGELITYSINKSQSTDGDAKSVLLRQESVGKQAQRLVEMDCTKDKWRVLANDESYSNFKKNIDLRIKNENSNVTQVISSSSKSEHGPLSKFSRKRVASIASMPEKLPTKEPRSNHSLRDHILHTLIVRPLNLVQLIERTRNEMQVPVDSADVTKCLSSLNARCSNQLYFLDLSAAKMYQIDISKWPFYSTAERQIAERIQTKFAKPSSHSDEISKTKNRPLTLQPSSVSPTGGVAHIKREAENSLPKNTTQSDRAEFIPWYKKKYPSINNANDRNSFFKVFCEKRKEYLELKQCLSNSVEISWKYFNDYFHQPDEAKRNQMEDFYKHGKNNTPPASLINRISYLAEKMDYLVKSILAYDKNNLVK